MQPNGPTLSIFKLAVFSAASSYSKIRMLNLLSSSVWPSKYVSGVFQDMHLEQSLPVGIRAQQRTTDLRRTKLTVQNN